MDSYVGTAKNGPLKTQGHRSGRFLSIPPQRLVRRSLDIVGISNCSLLGPSICCRWRESNKAVQLEFAMSTVWASLLCLVSARSFASVVFKLTFFRTWNGSCPSVLLTYRWHCPHWAHGGHNKEQRSKEPLSAIRPSHDSLGSFMLFRSALPEQSTGEGVMPRHTRPCPPPSMVWTSPGRVGGPQQPAEFAGPALTSLSRKIG